jgi:Tfp pilus assembly PilM family ATPase
MEVVLVAVRNQVVNGFLSTFELAGVKPKVVDVNLFALLWAGGCKDKGEQEDNAALQAALKDYNLTETGVAYLNVGPDESALLIASKGEYRLSRSVPLGIHRLVGDDGVDLPALNELMSEIRRNNDYYRKVIKGLVIRVCLSGEGAALEELRQALHNEIDAEVQVVDALKGFVNKSKVSADELHRLGPSMAVPVGLALRGLNRLD